MSDDNRENDNLNKQRRSKQLFKRNLQIVLIISLLFAMLFSYNHCSFKLIEGQVIVTRSPDDDSTTDPGEETGLDELSPSSDTDSETNGDTDSDSDDIVNPKFKFSLTYDEWKALEKNIKIPEQGDIYAEAITPTLISIMIVPEWDRDNNVYVRDLLDEVSVETATNFELFSEDDENYLENINPVSSGLHRKPILADKYSEDFRMGENIFLKLSTPLIPNINYSIRLLSGIFGDERIISFDYSATRFSHALHVNQEGYLTSQSKKAFLGMSLGSLGELDTVDPAFSIIRLEDREVIFEGIGTLQESDFGDYLGYSIMPPYQNVYELDFTSVEEEGEYIIYSEDFGYSFPFEVNKDAYRKSLVTLMGGLYHQKSGVALTLPYTKYVREGIGHPNDARVYTSEEILEIKGFTPAITSTLENEQIDATMGHYDAGDYGKYTHQGARVVWTLLTYLDNFSEELSHDNLGVPESGNGIPDLMDTLIHELTWLKNMQDPNDGGVFTMIKPEGWGYQADSLPDTYISRVAYPKGTIPTASYAAAIARAARSTELKKYAPDLIEELKSKAILAWSFLEAYPVDFGDAGEEPDYWTTHIAEDVMYTGFKYFHYGGFDGSHDDRAWAAIELYALTGDNKYYDSFIEYHVPSFLLWNSIEFTAQFGDVERTLFHWKDTDFEIPQDVLDDNKNYYKLCIDNYLDDVGKTPYNLRVGYDEKHWHTIGWFFPLSREGLDMYAAWKYFEDENYLSLLIDQVNYTYGANPLNRSFVTGLGYKRILEIADQESNIDDNLPLVFGLPVGHGSNGWHGSNQYYGEVRNYYPALDSDPWGAKQYTGLFEIYHDGYNIRDEFTITELINMAIIQALLTPVTSETNKFPTFEIKLNSSESNDTYQFEIEFTSSPPEKYQIIWHVYKVKDYYYSNYFSETLELENELGNPIYQVEAEIITDNGLRAWHKLDVNTRNYSNTNIPLAPLEMSEDTIALYHFDDGISDMTGNQYFEMELSEGVARDSSNILWALEPEGNSLNFSTISDYLKVELQSGHFSNELQGEITEVSFEWLMFIKKASDTIVKIGQRDIDDNRSAFAAYLNFDGNLFKTYTDDSEHELIEYAKNMWNYVKVTINEDGYTLFVNNEAVATVNDDEKLSDFLYGYPVKIFIGNFIGWIDELKVSVQSENMQTTDEMTEITIPSELCEVDESDSANNRELESFTGSMYILTFEDLNRTICSPRIGPNYYSGALYQDGKKTLNISFDYKVGSGKIKLYAASGGSNGLFVRGTESDTVRLISNSLSYWDDDFVRDIEIQSESGYVNVSISMIKNNFYIKITDDTGEKEIVELLDNDELHNTGFYTLYMVYGVAFDNLYISNEEIQ